MTACALSQNGEQAEDSLSGEVSFTLETNTHFVLSCVDASGKTYANTGSWTFTSSPVLRIAPEGVTLTDWLSGRRYDDRLYRPILEGKLDGVGYFEWWARHYRGWLRYALPLNKLTPGDAPIAARDQDR